jgi:hypothetical protein
VFIFRQNFLNIPDRSRVIAEYPVKWATISSLAATVAPNLFRDSEAQDRRSVGDESVS